MGFFKAVNKNSLIGSAINVLESIQSGDTFAEKMVLEFRREACKDEDIAFVLRTFKTKFGLQGFDMFVEPKINEGSLTIEIWNFVVNGEVLFTTNGLDSLIGKVSESIMTQDEVLVKDVVKKLKLCLA